MKIKFSISDFNTRFRYGIKQLAEFENEPDIRVQKCTTAIIILSGCVIYSLLATLISPMTYTHGKVTNVSIALFMLCMILFIRKTGRHRYICILTAFGTCAILFFHFITEIDWTIGMDAFWLFILVLPFMTNYLAGVVYGSISALSGLLLSILLFETPLNGYLQPYGQNMLDWFPIIYIVVMMGAAVMEYELTSYQIEKN